MLSNTIHVRSLFQYLWLCIAVIDSDALAADVHKIFTASACHPLGPGARYERYYGSIVNISESEYLDVACPLVREAKALSYTEVRINNQAGRTFICWVDSWDPTGAIGSWASGSTSIIGRGFVSIEDLDHTTYWPDGYYSLTCSIPPGSEIMSYKTIEPR